MWHDSIIVSFRIDMYFYICIAASVFALDSIDVVDVALFILLFTVVIVVFSRRSAAVMLLRKRIYDVFSQNSITRSE